jgi:outer membrane receptor for monomeric catechols
MSGRDDRQCVSSTVRAIAFAILVASSSAPVAPPVTDDARTPVVPPPAANAPALATDTAGPYAPAVQAPAGATVVPRTLMKEQGDFRLREGLRNVPGIGASGR